MVDGRKEADAVDLTFVFGKPWLLRTGVDSLLIDALSLPESNQGESRGQAKEEAGRRGIVEG